MLRRRKILMNQTCEHPGCEEKVHDVHHKRPIAEGGAVWDLDNLESLCKRHHSRETRLEQLA